MWICNRAVESILHWQGMERNAMNWTNEINWAVHCMKGRSSKSLVYRYPRIATRLRTLNSYP
uniref:Putative ovule protein n=1 Tax=Solanum chacoense TaxID=4108 RepID=A0A0V0GZG0_SOLCH